MNIAPGMSIKIIDYNLSQIMAEAHPWSTISLGSKFWTMLEEYVCENALAYGGKM
jgi:hypothetical protein